MMAGFGSEYVASFETEWVAGLRRNPHAHKQRRRRIEFLEFMNSIVATYSGKDIHVVLDNLNTHKKNELWLKRHPRVRFHFTPTRASWLNQVENWFCNFAGAVPHRRLLHVRRPTQETH